MPKTKRDLAYLIIDLLGFTAAEGAALDDDTIADLADWLRSVRAAKHATREVTPQFKKKKGEV